MAKTRNPTRHQERMGELTTQLRKGNRGNIQTNVYGLHIEAKPYTMIIKEKEKIPDPKRHQAMAFLKLPHTHPSRGKEETKVGEQKETQHTICPPKSIEAKSVQKSLKTPRWCH